MVEPLGGGGELCVFGEACSPQRPYWGTVEELNGCGARAGGERSRAEASRQLRVFKTGVSRRERESTKGIPDNLASQKGVE